MPSSASRKCPARFVQLQFEQKNSDHSCTTVSVRWALVGGKCGGKLLCCGWLEPKCENMGGKGNPVWSQIAFQSLKIPESRFWRLTPDKIVGYVLQVQEGSLMLSGRGNKWRLQQTPEQPFLLSAHSALSLQPLAIINNLHLKHLFLQPLLYWQYVHNKPVLH